MMFTLTFERVTWRCIHFLDEFTDSFAEELRSKGIVVFRVTLNDTVNEATFFDAISKVMKFPSYFGRNWDALDECLTDMQWEPARGHVLVLRGTRDLFVSQFHLVGKILHSWLYAAEIWAKREHPFHLVLLHPRDPEPSTNSES